MNTKHVWAVIFSAAVLWATTVVGQGGGIRPSALKPGSGRYQYGIPAREDYSSSRYAVADSSGGFYDEWIHDHLSIGLGVTTFHLTKNYREPDLKRDNNFIGAVNELPEERDVLLVPVVDYRVNDYFRVELSYADITAGTKNLNKDGQGDGRVNYRGPTLALEGTYPFFDGLFVPHAGIGIAVMRGKFEELTWWHLGYSSYESWATRGKPMKRAPSVEKGYREIRVDEFEVPIFFRCGVTCKPLSNWSIDFSLRYMSLDPDCEWGRLREDGFDRHRTGDFDLTHVAYTLSVAYHF